MPAGPWPLAAAEGNGAAVYAHKPPGMRVTAAESGLRPDRQPSPRVDRRRAGSREVYCVRRSADAPTPGGTYRSDEVPQSYVTERLVTPTALGTSGNCSFLPFQLGQHPHRFTGASKGIAAESGAPPVLGK